MQTNLINPPAVDPYTKVWDIRFVRFNAPDLDVMETFCLDFGMCTVLKTDTALYMRGYGEDSCTHITHKAAEASFVGIGLDATSAEELERFASKIGRPVEEFTEVGGGSVVRLESPEGYQVEVLWGSTPAEPILTTVAHVPSNFAVERDGNYGEVQRHGYVKRINQEAAPRGEFIPFHPNDRRAHEPPTNTPGPAHVMRLGHVVLGTANFRSSEAWWKQHFGFITSDEIHEVGDESSTVGACLCGSVCVRSPSHVGCLGFVWLLGNPVFVFEKKRL